MRMRQSGGWVPLVSVAMLLLVVRRAYSTVLPTYRTCIADQSAYCSDAEVPALFEASFPLKYEPFARTKSRAANHVAAPLAANDTSL